MSILDSITGRLGSFIGLNTELPKPKYGGFDIQEFKSNINALNGVLPTNLFLVTIYRRNGGGTSQHLQYFTMKTDLPGLDIAIDENIVNGVGVIERFPHAAIFTDLELQIIADGNGLNLQIFQWWMNNIVQYDKNYGKVFDRPETFHRVSYRDDYVCDITITVFNQSSDKIFEYTLYDAFPYRLNNISMNWADQNSLMVIGVNFFFKYWTCEHFMLPEAKPSSLTFLQKLIKGATIVETIASLKKPQNVGDAINILNNANIISSGLSGF